MNKHFVLLYGKNIWRAYSMHSSESTSDEQDLAQYLPQFDYPYIDGGLSKNVPIWIFDTEQSAAVETLGYHNDEPTTWQKWYKPSADPPSPKMRKPRAKKPPKKTAPKISLPAPVPLKPTKCSYSVQICYYGQVLDAQATRQRYALPEEHGGYVSMTHVPDFGTPEELASILSNTYTTVYNHCVEGAGEVRPVYQAAQVFVDLYDANDAIIWSAECSSYEAMSRAIFERIGRLKSVSLYVQFYCSWPSVAYD